MSQLLQVLIFALALFPQGQENRAMRKMNKNEVPI